MSGQVMAAVSVETRPSPSVCGSTPTGTGAITPRRSLLVRMNRGHPYSDSQTGVGLDREARESSASRALCMRVEVAYPRDEPRAGLAASLPG